MGTIPEIFTILDVLYILKERAQTSNKWILKALLHLEDTSAVRGHSIAFSIMYHRLFRLFIFSCVKLQLKNLPGTQTQWMRSLLV